MGEKWACVTQQFFPLVQTLSNLFFFFSPIQQFNHSLTPLHPRSQQLKIWVGKSLQVLYLKQQHM